MYLYVFVWKKTHVDRDYLILTEMWQGNGKYRGTKACPYKRVDHQLRHASAVIGSQGHGVSIMPSAAPRQRCDTTLPPTPNCESTAQSV